MQAICLICHRFLPFCEEVYFLSFSLLSKESKREKECKRMDRWVVRMFLGPCMVCSMVSEKRSPGCAMVTKVSVTCKTIGMIYGLTKCQHIRWCIGLRPRGGFCRHISVLNQIEDKRCTHNQGDILWPAVSNVKRKPNHSDILWPASNVKM